MPARQKSDLRGEEGVLFEAAGEENPKELCPLRFSSPEPPPFLNPNCSGLEE